MWLGLLLLFVLLMFHFGVDPLPGVLSALNLVSEWELKWLFKGAPGDSRMPRLRKSEQKAEVRIKASYCLEDRCLTMKRTTIVKPRAGFGNKKHEGKGD